MNRQKKWMSTILVTCLVLFGSVYVPQQKALAFSPQVIKHGAVGQDVIELQSRLKYIGFYHGKIDGVFGWGTYWALRRFQYRFGLPIDGVAGADTKDKLVKSTKYNSSNSQAQSNQNNTTNKTAKPGGGSTTQTKAIGNNLPNGFSANDLKLMANAVYGESRGEPFKGQVAVAAVILHRVANPKFPNTVSGVIFQPGAFTAVADGQIWLTPNAEAKKAVLDAINGWDPSNGAMYYFNPNTATSGWIWGRPQIMKIGKHIFTK